MATLSDLALDALAAREAAQQQALTDRKNRLQGAAKDALNAMLAPSTLTDASAKVIDYATTDARNALVVIGDGTISLGLQTSDDGTSWQTYLVAGSKKDGWTRHGKIDTLADLGALISQ